MSDNYSVKDGAGADLAIRSIDLASSGIHSPCVTPLVGVDPVTTANPLPTSGLIANPTANFTRPADTSIYAVGDLVANSTTAGSVTPLNLTVARAAAGSFLIRRARLFKSGTSLTNAFFRLHLYRSSPTPTNGDNGAWLTAQSGYLGAFDLVCDRAFSDGAHGAAGYPLNGSEMSVKLSSGQAVYGLLEARGAYTPVSAEVFTVELEVYQN